MSRVAVIALLFATPTLAADLRSLDDAPLFAIQFVDAREGWACGADGVIWHSIDGGKHWERQATGSRAVLRSICFVNPYTGWAVGREEESDGSRGVMLFTNDGGLKWSAVGGSDLPGLNCVRFFDEKIGIAAGDCTDREPSGVWLTRDGGKTWSAATGPRGTTWRAADFADANTGAMAGAWGRLAAIRGGVLAPADVDKLGGRNVLGLKLSGKRGVAVGQQGLVLLSQDSAGLRWGFADLRLPAEVTGSLDFHATACLDERIWITGQPGSVVIHSSDFGKSWQMQPTGQSLPLHAVQFLDHSRGWAVGECGTIIGTSDGGKTWTIQRRGAQRAAASFAHACPKGVPLETVALLGGDDGYITSAVCVTSADPATDDLSRANDPDRWLAAQRKVGGAGATGISGFLLPSHLIDASRADLAAAWDKQQRTSSQRRLVQQLAQHLRTWRPDVVVTDFAGAAPESTVEEALREAFDRAGDPQAFPEQLTLLKLEPWSAKKLFAVWEGPGAATALINATEPRRRLNETPREFATPAFRLLTDRAAELPERRAFRLLAGNLPGHDLMAGVALAYGGTARRSAPQDDDDPEQIAAIERSLRERRNLQALGRPDWGKLSDSGAMLAQIGPMLAKLPPDQGASAAYSLAQQYARSGQWHLAREAFLLMVDRFPTHPLAADAYRWLANYHASSEFRRREELGHFLVLTTSDIKLASTLPSRENPVRSGIGIKEDRPLAQSSDNQQSVILGNMTSARRWYEGALAVEPRLAKFGARAADDPAVQFAMNAARRHLGDFDKPKAWYRSYLMQPRLAGQPGADPWRENAAAELWLLERNGQAPKPVATCRQTATRPHLDGKLDDSCWEGAKPIALKDLASAIEDGFATKAMLAYDAEYLYVALECRHPKDRYVAPVEKRSRDADLRPFDRVGMMLDLDRDYQTYFHWQIDQRGAVAEDCWGDRSWNPRWLVAHQSGADGWSAELALPLAEITGDAVPLGKTWCLNLVRVVPGKGVHAFSLPAGATPRPEGMGLVVFTEK